jgi:chorismate dehydratase
VEQYPIRISVVSYLNALPFVAGLKGNSDDGKYTFSLDIPSICAEKLICGEVDLGLIPVAKIADMQSPIILTNYCIGADGEVLSVLIVANQELDQLTNIILDSESRTSVELAKILVRDFWKKEIQWNEETGYDIMNLPKNYGAVIIGDRALLARKHYPFSYDLGTAWKKHTGLPFVFACWVANKFISDETEQYLNMIFENGLAQREKILEEKLTKFNEINIRNYFFEHIKYNLTAEARKGLELFLELRKTI